MAKQFYVNLEEEFMPSKPHVQHGPIKSVLNLGSILKLIANSKSVDWLQDYDDALEKAYMTSGEEAVGARVVMAFFTGSDWCPHCKALSTEVFNDVSFKIWFNWHLMVPLLLDYPQNTPQPDEIKLQNAILAKQYNITGFPTVVAIKAGSGYCTGPGQKCVVQASEVRRVVGYQSGSGVDSWIDSFWP
jgi:thiol-disulfide isomerase/thioredoxin